MRVALALLLACACAAFAGPESVVFEFLDDDLVFDSTVVSGVENEFAIRYDHVNSISNSMRAYTEGAAGDAIGYGSFVGGVYTTLRFYFYLSSDFDATVAVAMFALADGGQDHVKLRFTGDESMSVRVWDKNAAAYSAWSSMTGYTPSKEAWHLVEIYLHARDADAFTYNVWIFIDDVKLYEITDEMAGVVLDNFYVGLDDIDSGDAGAIYFDDVVVDTMRWTHGADYRPVDGLIPPVRSTVHDLFGGGIGNEMD